jgi:hypothetical protein
MQFECGKFPIIAKTADNMKKRMFGIFKVSFMRHRDTMFVSR